MPKCVFYDLSYSMFSMIKEIIMNVLAIRNQPYDSWHVF